MFGLGKKRSPQLSIVVKKEVPSMTMSQQEAQKLRDQLSNAAGQLNRVADVIEARNKTIGELSTQVTEKDQVISQRDARIKELESQVAQLKQQADTTGKAVSEGSKELGKASERLKGLTG